MSIIYNLGIRIYSLGISIASPFNKKAKSFKQGRKLLFNKIAKQIKPHKKLIWIHAASSGEFEQARPIIELFKQREPDTAILVSFFSPSGYEMHKHNGLTDYIFYLPIDTPKNAKKWIDLINPTIVLLIKYEFWSNYIATLKAKNIPVYSVCSIFRHNQSQLKKSWGVETLKNITHFFVQDENSKLLLLGIGINEVTIIGDTRFDRVYKIAHEKVELPIIRDFANDNTTIVAGSTWPADEDLLIKFINDSKHQSLKIIIVPHEIEPSHIQNICKKIKHPYALYSEIKEPNFENVKVLIVDKMGLLSSIYRYAELAYVGGGFGVGIHNVLEAACYEIPVIFGPNYKKFKEARDLISHQAGISISDYDQFSKKLESLLSDELKYKQMTAQSKDYINENLGATEKLYQYIKSSTK